MESCRACDASIVFGGEEQYGARFCNETCVRRYEASEIFPRIKTDALVQALKTRVAGPCPRCGAQAPCDIECATTVHSYLVLTRRWTDQEFCCRACGRKMRFSAKLQSLLFGWWAFPWGPIRTIQMLQDNLDHQTRSDLLSPQKPSAELVYIVQQELSAQLPPLPAGSRSR